MSDLESVSRKSSSSSDSDSNFFNQNFWTIHVETKPELPDEIFYIKNVYGEQNIGDFKKSLCKIINRKVKDTKFFREGEEMDDSCSLDFYGKDTEDICIQHAMKRVAKKTIINWLKSL